MTDHDAKAEAKAKLAARPEPKRGHVYRHYKGGLYTVVSVSIDEKTLEPLVTYYSHEYPSEIDTTRRLEVFEEIVEAPDGMPARRYLREVD